MTATMTKLKAEPTTPSLKAAEARWAEIDLKWRKMIEQREGIRMAQSLSLDRNNQRVPQRLRDKAAPFMKLAVRRPERLDEQLADVWDEIDDFDPEYQAERDIWNAARRRETTKLAGELQPRHRAAVEKIGEALSALSRAMEEEVEIHAELARTAPEAESALLPNCIVELVIGTLADWNSPASEWARRMRKLGILE